MASPQPRDGVGSSALLLGTMAGAVLGAAGLGWYLWARAEERRTGRRPFPLLTRERLDALAEGLAEPLAHRRDKELQQKVHQLNQAIDEVRRQLEQLQPQP